MNVSAATLTLWQMIYVHLFAKHMCLFVCRGGFVFGEVGKRVGCFTAVCVCTSGSSSLPASFSPQLLWFSLHAGCVHAYLCVCFWDRLEEGCLPAYGCYLTGPSYQCAPYQQLQQSVPVLHTFHPQEIYLCAIHVCTQIHTHTLTVCGHTHTYTIFSSVIP